MTMNSLVKNVFRHAAAIVGGITAAVTVSELAGVEAGAGAGFAAWWLIADQDSRKSLFAKIRGYVPTRSTPVAKGAPADILAPQG